MAITINHPFVSAKGDGSDATLVRPSNWNASHNLNMATNRMIGRKTAGPGLAEEIPASTYMMDLLATADFAALAAALGLPTTGDAKLTFKIVADAGWILANDGSIGDALSGATTLAHATATTALFTFFYDTFSDAIAPLQLSTGGVTTRAVQGAAGTAFGAHCRMVIPRQLGRALIIAGTGAGLTARAVGGFGGEENHQLTVAELAAHSHTVTPSGTNTSTDLTHSHTQTGTHTSNTVSAHTHTQAGTHGSTGVGDHTHTQAGTFTSAGMNRSNPHSHGTGGTGNGVWLRSTLGGNQTGGGQFSLADGSVSINNTDINHEHDVTISGQTAGAGAHSHTTTLSGETASAGSHAHTTTISGQTGNGLTTHSHTFTGDLNTTSTTGSNTAHNNMQPWTAWNIMIKL